MSNFCAAVSEMTLVYLNAESIYSNLGNEELTEIIKNDTSLYHVNEAKAALVSNMVKLVVKTCNKVLSTHFAPGGIDSIDILGEAIFAMLKLVETYDQTKGKFTTYAAFNVERHIEKYLLTSGYVAVSEGTARRIKKAVAIHNRLFDEGITDMEEIYQIVAAEMDIKKFSTVKKLLDTGLSGMYSPKSFTTYDEDGNETNSMDYIPSHRGNPEDYILAFEEIQERAKNDKELSERLERFSLAEFLAS